MKSKIIISDVHGCYETLMKLIDQLPHDNIVFAGDLIDRGPKSREVVNFVKNGGYNCVIGNHEDLMIQHKGLAEDKTVYGVNELNNWGYNGGLETLKSYKGYEDELKEHLEWLKELPYVIAYDKIVNDKGEKLMVSHSIAYTAFKQIDLIDEERFGDIIMWNRDFYNIQPLEGYYNVFGHTPQNGGPKIKSFYSCIDTGCVYGSSTPGVRNGYGVLTALEFPSLKVYKQSNLED